MDSKRMSVSRVAVTRVGLALAIVLATFGAARPAAADTPPPDVGENAETGELLTLVGPAGARALARPAASRVPAAPLGQALGSKIEPNGFFTQATAGRPT